MQLLITGTPGCLFQFVCDLLAADSDRLAAPILLRHCDPADASSMCAGKVASTRHIFITNYPSASSLEVALEGRLPSIIVLDSPLQSFLDLRQAGHDATGITRSLSACTTALGGFAGSPAALFLGPEARQTRDTALQAIFAHAGWPFATEPNQTAQGSSQMEPPAKMLSPYEQTLIHGVLDPAFHFAATGERLRFIWPRAALLAGDNPGQPAPAILNLTGPARVIVYGPYFHLPPGHWTAQARFAFSPSARGTRLALEFHATGPLARYSFQAKQAGVFRIDLPIHVRSAREAIEIRLVLEHGAIEGHLGLDDIQLLPRDR